MASPKLRDALFEAIQDAVNKQDFSARKAASSAPSRKPQTPSGDITRQVQDQLIARSKGSPPKRARNSSQSRRGSS